MRTLLIFVTAALFPLQAFADDWQLLSSEDGIQIFANKSSRLETVLGSRFWLSLEAASTAAVEGKAYRSIAVQIETDCQTDRVRQVAMMYYRDPSRQGPLVHSTTHISNWTPAPPGTKGAAAYLKFGCER